MRNPLGAPNAVIPSGYLGDMTLYPVYCIIALGIIASAIGVLLHLGMGSGPTRFIIAKFVGPLDPSWYAYEWNEATCAPARPLRYRPPNNQDPPAHDDRSW